MGKARQRVALFAIIIGKLIIIIPYMSHREIPITKMRNIPRDISFVLFVLHVFINCGRKDIVVNKPAK